MGKKDIKSEMGEFIPESVAASIVPTVKQNTPFIITEKGKHLFIGMLLDVNKIGGINKKAINDTDKGGVIEAIKSGHIDAYVTQELNDENLLLFIPTANTLDRLGDYGMFRKVDGYEFVKLNDKLEIVERTGITATYDEFRMIGSGSAEITDYVKPAEDVKSAEDVILKGSDEDPTASHNVAEQAISKLKDVGSSIMDKVAPITSKIAENVKEKFAESTGLNDMREVEKPVEQPIQEEPETEQAVDEETSEEYIEEQEIVYTETEVFSSIERVFHANKLDLPVSSEPFDQLFTLNNHLIKFDVDPRDTFVNERLNRMAIDANRDLQKLRSDNLKKLREKYFMLMSLRVQEIADELDIENLSTAYGDYKHNIEQTKTERLSNLSKIVEERQNLIEKEYNARMEEQCENASRKARAEFKARYQRPHNDDLNAVEGIVRAEIAADYEASLNDMYIARRNDALTSLDLNITGVLQVLTEDYKQMFEEENALYMKRADEMREYAKELHMLDAKRLAVEEERNRITNEVNDARAEASAKIELIKKEYETAQAALEARSEAMISQANNENKLIKEQMDARTAALELDKEKLQQQFDEALARADKAQEIVRADYEHRLVQAQDDRDSWKQTLETYREQHKHNNRLAAILVVAITIAAVAGGFVAGGVYWNRVVANELSGSQENIEVKVINPEETSSEKAPVSSDTETGKQLPTTSPAVTTAPATTSAVTKSSTTKPAVTTKPAITTAPATTKTTKVSTTKAPEVTTKASTTKAPVVTTKTSTTKAPVATTKK